MKKLFVKFISLILSITALCLTLVGCEKEPEVKELGIPTERQFSLGAMARCPWDLTIFENKVFVGSGDYGLNTGPIVIWAYDMQSGKFVSTGDVRDETVSSFKIIGGKLTAPGIDPMGSWSVGSFYQYDDGKWKSYSKIPNGVHNFDIVEFGGKIYAGLGVEHVNSPIAVSNGVNDYFEFIYPYKNGEKIDATTMDLLQYRCYDLFVINNELYAMICFAKSSGSTLEIFKLNGDRFEYVSDASVLLTQRQYGTNLIDSKAVVGNVAYFVRGNLYSSTNLVDFNKIDLPNGGMATDLLVEGNALYVLSYTQEEDKCNVVIYKMDGGAIEKVVDFDYSVRPLSFVKSGDTYYVGMGDRSSLNEKNGMILSVKA